MLTYIILTETIPCSTCKEGTTAVGIEYMSVAKPMCMKCRRTLTRAIVTLTGNTYGRKWLQ